MPTCQIIFHRLAAREYRSAKDWYRQRSQEVAKRFAVAVDQSIERIVADADSLPVLIGAYRYIRIHRFPYILIFRFLDPNVAMVIAVAHASRRPGYWRGRRQCKTISIVK